MRQRAGSRLQRTRWLACALLLATLSLTLHPATADANVFTTLIRKVGGVANDVPLNKADDIAGELASSRAGRRAVDHALREAGAKVDDAAARRRAIQRLLRDAVGEADPLLVRQLDELDRPAREAAFVLARGSHAIREGVPDIAARGRFVKNGGADTVAALGRYDDLVDDAIRFDAAVRAGRITSPPGLPAVSTQNFGRFFRVQGDRARHFWSKYVQPHWGKWLGGAALAAVILAPDEYLDAAGDLTEEGLRKLGKFAGSLLSGLLKGLVGGAGEATKETAKETAKAFWDTFFTDVWGPVALVVILGAVVLIIPCLRGGAVVLFKLAVPRLRTPRTETKDQSAAQPDDSKRGTPQ